MKKVLYEELLPEECVQRIKEMPVAYLPLGTLEWHGPHMPLGADGIQSKELFVRVAEKVGGVVLPMLFMGPDRLFDDRGTVFYGMDIKYRGRTEYLLCPADEGQCLLDGKGTVSGSAAQYFCTAFQSRSPHRCGTWTRSVNKCISGNEGRGRRKIRTVHYDSMDLCG